MIIYALTATGTSFEIFKNYFWYYFIAIILFSLIGVVFLFLLNTKDIIRELPPFIMPNTGNMGLPICLFAYGSQGLGVAAAISALIILSHFTLGIFLAARKFNFDVILKSPPFYTIIISVFLLYFEIKSPVFIENTTFLLMYETHTWTFPWSTFNCRNNVRSLYVGHVNYIDKTWQCHMMCLRCNLHHASVAVKNRA